MVGKNRYGVYMCVHYPGQVVNADTSKTASNIA